MMEMKINEKTVTAMEINGKNVTELEIGGKLFTFKKPLMESFDYYWLYYKKNDGYNVDNFAYRNANVNCTFPRFQLFNDGTTSLMQSQSGLVYNHTYCLKFHTQYGNLAPFLNCSKIFVGDYSNIQLGFAVKSTATGTQSLSCTITLIDTPLPDITNSSNRADFVNDYFIHEADVGYADYAFEVENIGKNSTKFHTINIPVPDSFTNREFTIIVFPLATAKNVDLYLTDVCLCNSDEVIEYPKPGEFAFLVVDGYNGFKKSKTNYYYGRDYSYLVYHDDQYGDDGKWVLVRTELRGESNNYNLNSCDYTLSSTPSSPGKVSCTYSSFGKFLPSSVGKRFMYDYYKGNEESRTFSSPTSGVSYATRSPVQTSSTCFSYAKLTYNNLDPVPVQFYIGARHVEDEN